MQQGIDDFFSPSSVEYKKQVRFSFYKFYCINSKQSCTSRKSITTLPSFLFVRINRFSELDDTKNTRMLDIDTLVTLKGQTYVIYSVIWHRGSSRNSGHYGVLVNEQCKMYWNNYDDRKVTRVSKLKIPMKQGLILFRKDSRSYDD